MRVKFGNSIYLCTKVSHTPNSKILLFTTSNGVYSVDMKNSINSLSYYYEILTEGYCDLSEYEYSN